MKADPSALKVASESLERLKARPVNHRWTEWLDKWLLNAGRILLIASVLLGLLLFARAVLRKRKMIQFLPFRASTDDAAKQMAFWLERVLADLRSPAPTLPLAPGLTSSLPFMALPGLADPFPELDFEVGGAKIPFQALAELFAKPRARVTGTWYAGATGAALATIERRWRLEYVPFSHKLRPIHHAAGVMQDHDLELFAYAVYIEASKT